MDSTAGPRFSWKPPVACLGNNRRGSNLFYFSLPPNYQKVNKYLNHSFWLPQSCLIWRRLTDFTEGTLRSNLGHCPLPSRQFVNGVTRRTSYLMSQGKIPQLYSENCSQSFIVISLLYKFLML